MIVKRFIKNYFGTVFGLKLFIGALGVFILFQLDAGMPLFFTEYHWNVLSENYDFKMIFSNTIYFGMYMHMLTMLSAAGFGTRFCEEWRSGVVPHLVKNMDLKHYSTLYIILATVSGGSIAVLGFIMYVLSIVIHVPLWSRNALKQNSLIGLYEFTLEDESGLQFIVIFVMLFFLVGALSAVIAICISTFSENKYLVMTSPYIIYRCYVELCKAIHIPNNYRVDYYLFGRQELGTHLGEICFIIIGLTAVVIVGGRYVFAKGVRRKLINGKY